MPIHDTAVVDPRATIHCDANIGPFCVVGPNVKVGAHTHLIANVIVQGRTSLGQDNVVHPFASLGGAPQDLKYGGEDSRLVIGNNNIIRESTTINLGTKAGHMQTTLGDSCLIMAYAHIAHDCVLGDGVILVNGVQLAGHVQIDDNAIISGLAAIHQHCRVGRLAFVGGGAMVARDVPPFCTAQGDRATLAGLNLVGLRRAGFSRERIHCIRRGLHQLIIEASTRGCGPSSASDVSHDSDDLQQLRRFIVLSQRGICSMRRQSKKNHADKKVIDAPRADV